MTEEEQEEEREEEIIDIQNMIVETTVRNQEAAEEKIMAAVSKAIFTYRNIIINSLKHSVTVNIRIIINNNNIMKI